MASAAFWGRYAARRAILATGAAGPRDWLAHYERNLPWRPPQGLAEFIAALIRAQALADAGPRARAFLEFWAPRQGLAAGGSALIEFSFTTNHPGFGVMLYGENAAMVRAFREWCRRDGIAAEAAGRCAAICETFHPTELTMVRAEFAPGEPTRTSIASSWFLDPLRLTGGFAARLRGLPPALREPALTDRIAALEADLAGEFFPLFLGFSLDGDAVEPKLYFLRHADEPPLAPGGGASRVLAGLTRDDAALSRVRAAYGRLWAASSDPIVQLLVGVSRDGGEPLRVNLISCGTRTGAVKDVLAEAGLDPRAVRPFEAAMQTGRAKYVALRVTPTGLSPRVKLYGHARFALGS